MALGLVLFVTGSRRVPAAEAALLTCLEAPLAPLWVCLALGEMPSASTLAGGGLVLAAVAGHFAAERRPLGGRPWSLLPAAARR